MASLPIIDQRLKANEFFLLVLREKNISEHIEGESTISALLPAHHASYKHSSFTYVAKVFEAAATCALGSIRHKLSGRVCCSGEASTLL